MMAWHCNLFGTIILRYMLLHVPIRRNSTFKQAPSCHSFLWHSVNRQYNIRLFTLSFLQCILINLHSSTASTTTTVQQP